jgi:hypothetical protein
MKTGLIFIFLAVGTISFDVQNFSFPLLEIFKTGQQAVAPKLAKLEKMEVDPIDSNTKTDMHLIEFLFLNMDFNFADTVPKSEKLTFKLPDI